ncbi:hypothetical protein G6F57_010366 [Rhizopus arrhizus]|uniref:F-box domain-containing protein n=1 Tax=Rhizopus oryzae TaxID=64495 RepID=A0A9P6WZC5_RHIOR|nr:hypothetical protein G6F23_009135 [Rhizopus arrhizus]KAG1406349.1 hypothetical protein G6F58_009847 [Rhizopus delemar]KAG0775163.1 hypothetical protein G6F22_013508 [Rhizopus arrhizus]KAG0783642.1 hypothetical protein G6F21_010415 [Rhizopus arrhizus]KAG0805773.1 hypothetical protein G6F20_011642 [Rhizopus arrhizus]
MLDLLPIELFWSILSYLDYQDLTRLLFIPSLQSSTDHFIQLYFPFHHQVSLLLHSFEQTKDINISSYLLESICEQVQEVSIYERKTTFNDLLATLQQLTVERVLAEDLKEGLEQAYALLCLEIRSRYLHTASIRVLHDPKYRRRSTKYPLAPFLPRVFTYIWRHHCSQKMTENQKIRIRFANYFGRLFEVTSLYLESNLDGSFEECVREALVTGNAQDLLVLCLAAGRPVDVEEMCRMVYLAGEQFRVYLDSMDHWIHTDPTPQQELRMQRNQELREQRQREGTESVDEAEEIIPDWLIPDRYKVHKDTMLRLKLMNNLFNKGWRWFPVY